MTLQRPLSSPKHLQLTINAPSDTALENPFDFLRAQIFSRMFLNIAFRRFIMSHPRLRDQVQCLVQLPVTMAIQPVTFMVSGRSLQRSNAMTYKFLSEFHKSPSQAIARPARYFSLCQEKLDWPGEANFPGPYPSFENLPNGTPGMTKLATNF